MYILRRAVFGRFAWILAGLFVLSGGMPAISMQFVDESRVVAVFDGDTVELENGARVRLVGIQAPELAHGRAGKVDMRFGQEASEALADLVMGKRVMLRYSGRRLDKYGRILAHLYMESGLWVQGELLRKGLAMVYSFPDNVALVQEMYEIESMARAKKLGLWALEQYQPRDAERVRATGWFGIVRGRILRAEKRGKRWYLNFGANYRTDFTLVLRRKNWDRFRDKGIDPAQFAGKEVEIRGVLIPTRNGPMISLTHPEQIIVLP